MPLYDHPFYKQLPKNDLGRETNQGGLVIPLPLLPYFPPLPVATANPTEEEFLTLDLFDGPIPVGTVTSRWHYQTRNRTRTPEYRLTRQIESALLERAMVDDLLVFERQADTTHRYRVTLVRSDTERHRLILRSSSGERWGLVNGEHPGSLAGITREMDDVLNSSNNDFQLFSERASETGHARLLRDAAFARAVKRAYGHSCAACGSGWLVPVGEPGLDPTSEPEAAHIVPVALSGSDDLRNGLCLCRAHHWAFDRRILFVDADRLWRVIPASEKENHNTSLNELDGVPLRKPRDQYPAPADEALAWHRMWVLSA